MDQDVCVGYRRTRSQGVPDWSIAESVILVNEIAAVDGDCLNTVSSYQKWKIVAENCTLLDVVRTSSQCRRKWDSLLVDYRKIAEYEDQFSNDPYWSLEPHERREFGLPVAFDHELFKAMDNLLRVKEDRSETDPENDPEDHMDVVETGAGSKSGVSGLKRKKGLSISQEMSLQEKPVKSIYEEMPRKSQRSGSGIKHFNAENKPSQDEALAGVRLRENAELVISMVKSTGAREKDTEEELDVISRRQGDKLITYLSNIINTLGESYFDAVRVHGG